MKSFIIFLTLLKWSLANLNLYPGEKMLYSKSSQNFTLAVDVKFLEVCGLKFKNRIVGGADSLPNSWPWSVSIHFNYKHICGGTLISNQWVLTAAHCIEYSTFSAYKVLLGAHNITNAGVGTSTIRMGVSKIISHEEYIGRYSFDIALIKLIKPVEFSMEIFPACVANLEDNFEKQNCYFSGWGYAFANGEVELTLREISLSVLNKTECSKYIRSEPEQKYCTGRQNVNQDTCQGDSGGGMMCLKPDGRWYVGGIVSYAIGSCGNVGINARVDYFRNWIDKTLKNN